MKKVYTALAVLAAAGLCACGKKQPENIPQPKAEDGSVAVSTPPAVEQNPLKAGENYLKRTVGQVDKAKAAAAVYEDAAKEHFNAAGLEDDGGE